MLPRIGRATRRIAAGVPGAADAFGAGDAAACARDSTTCADTTPVKKTSYATKVGDQMCMVGYYN